MRYLLAGAVAAVMLTGFAQSSQADAPLQRREARAGSSVSLHLSRHAVLSGDSVLLHGRVRPGGRRLVKLVLRGRERRQLVLRAKPTGAFSTGLRINAIGPLTVTAYAIHGREARAAASPVRRLVAYAAAVASYYGPGLWGGALACGGTLQPGTLGVANRTLPCGARVRLRYRGRSIVVPVIDRGPYAAGRDFDLTAATRQRLGFPSLGVLLFSRAGG